MTNTLLHQRGVQPIIRAPLRFLNVAPAGSLNGMVSRARGDSHKRQSRILCPGRGHTRTIGDKNIFAMVKLIPFIEK